MTDGRHRTPRFTVDDLFDLLPTLTTGREPGRPGPLAGVRAEVLDGRLLLAPPPLRRHERVADNLATRLRLVLPGVAQVSRHDAVRLPDGDGPVPDLLVTTERDWPRGWPAAAVHTVAEVVTADGRHIDRVWKRERYADAGIPCFWRVELAAWPGYRGPLPVVAIRIRERTGWRDLVAPAGRLHTLPIAYGRDGYGAAVTVPVRLDPVTLASRPATGR